MRSTEDGKNLELDILLRLTNITCIIQHRLYGKGQQEFEKSLQQLLDAIADMMKLTEDNTLTVQAHCLKYITTTIPDIITTFDPVAMR